MPSRIKCRNCGAESYAAGDTGLVCIRCYNQQAERITELEAENAKRPAKPLYGEARSRLLKAMDNSAHVDDAIEKYAKLKQQIEELEAILTRIIDTKKNWEYYHDEIGIALCCSDCPGRETGKVMTVGDIRKLSKKGK